MLCFVFWHLWTTVECLSLSFISKGIGSTSVFFQSFNLPSVTNLATLQNPTMRSTCLSGTVVTGNEVMRASLGVHSMESDALTRGNPDRSTEL